jgi:hypothetical protein
MNNLAMVFEMLLLNMEVILLKKIFEMLERQRDNSLSAKGVPSCDGGAILVF